MARLVDKLDEALRRKRPGRLTDPAGGFSLSRTPTLLAELNAALVHLARAEAEAETIRTVSIGDVPVWGLSLKELIAAASETTRMARQVAEDFQAQGERVQTIWRVGKPGKKPARRRGRRSAA